MPAVFADTSFWVAFVDGQDRRHAKARDWFVGFDGRLVTTSDIVDETVTLVRRRCGHAVALQVGEHLRRPLDVDLLPIEDIHRDAAWALFRARGDKQYSLTDCTSFVVMRRLGLEQTVTFDQDFAHEGFRVVP